MRRNQESSLLVFVVVILGFAAFLCVYVPVSYLYQCLTACKLRYEEFLNTFDGWVL